MKIKIKQTMKNVKKKKGVHIQTVQVKSKRTKFDAFGNVYFEDNPKYLAGRRQEYIVHAKAPKT